MKFVIFIIDDLTASGTEAEMKEIDIFNDYLRNNGHWITAEGIDSPTKSTVIDNRNEANMLLSESLVKSKENYSGFWLIEAPSIEVAKELALQGSKSCNRKVELRPLFG
jgi:hypothetical protein